MRVGIVGCGLIGRKRAEALRAFPGDVLAVVADVREDRARALAAAMGCHAVSDWQEVVAAPGVDAVVVCTTNDWLTPVALAAVQRGKHVLVEKPMSRSPDEAAALEAAVSAWPDVVVKVGFNHRYHPAIWKAREMVGGGAAGDLLYARCRYGHGGRPGYDTEWRADPAVAGGGELLDQGIHAIDLFRWFLGDFAEAAGFTAGYVWTAGGRLEDNAFALFRTRAGQVASLHASWTQWRNLFSFELFGTTGYLLVEGLGGSYGTERLTVGRRRMEGGPPEEDTVEFSGPGQSWEAEWRDFASAIREHRQPLATYHDGAQAVRLVAAVYESARTGKVVKV